MSRGVWILLGMVGAGAGWFWFGGGRDYFQNLSLPSLPGLPSFNRAAEVVHERDGHAWFRVRGNDLEQRAIETCFELDNRELKTGQETPDSLKFCCRPRQGGDCDRPEQPAVQAPPPPPPEPEFVGQVRFVDLKGKPIPAERALDALDARKARIEFEHGARIQAVDPAGERTTLGAEQYNRAMVEGYAIEINGLFCRLKSAPRPVAHPLKLSTNLFECW